jgi:SREBP regulating gene protein
VADSNGWVCERSELIGWKHANKKKWSDCCSFNRLPAVCYGCDILSQCCSEFEYCISCCLQSNYTETPGFTYHSNDPSNSTSRAMEDCKLRCQTRDAGKGSHHTLHEFRRDECWVTLSVLGTRVLTRPCFWAHQTWYSNEQFKYCYEPYFFDLKRIHDGSDDPKPYSSSSSSPIKLYHRRRSIIVAEETIKNRTAVVIPSINLIRYHRMQQQQQRRRHGRL